MSEWISIKDRLPEGRVLICFLEPFFGVYTEELAVGYYDEDSQKWRFWIPDKEVRGGGVTHWQPLPEPPHSPESKLKQVDHVPPTPGEK